MDLNIIGNGFDLYHGLPSSFYYFGCYLIEKNPELFMTISKWFDFRYFSTIRGYPYEDFEYGVEKQFWSEFEECLGEVEDNAIIGTYDYDLGLEIEEYDIPMEDYLLADEIRKAFVSWVSETLDVERNYKTINKYRKKPPLCNMKFSNTDKFLLFNYTHTLQKVYQIGDYNICYVHGECTGEEDDDLVFGHCNQKRIQEIKAIIEEYDKRILCQSERITQLEHECLLKFMRSLQKDVEGCKSFLDYFYDCFIGEPEYINIYGMSLSDIDYPYLEQIKMRWPDAKWRFGFFSKSDSDRIDVISQKLDLFETQYNKFEFRNDESENIKTEIVNNLGIVKYKQI